MSARFAGWRAGAAELATDHQPHVGVASVAVGLAMAGLAGPAAVLVAAVVLGAGGVWILTVPVRRILPLLVVVVAAGLVGGQRVDALRHTNLTASFGRGAAGDTTLLSAPRADAFGRRRAMASWHGEHVLLRFPPWREVASGGIGDVLRVRGTLRKPDRAAVALGAHATLLAESAAATGGRRGGLPGLVDGVRRRAERALAAQTPPTEGALLRGMVLGQDDALPDDVRDTFRTAGLSHLVAASGQNILLLAALVLGLAAIFGLGVRVRWLLVVGVIAVYVPLAGGGAPIQRAGVMGTCMAAAVLAGRPASRWYALLLAAAVTLALDPREVRAAGWQLSFAAVLGIALLAPRITAWLQRRGVPAALGEALATTASATLVTAPILAAQFGQVSLVALPANVLVAPAVPMAMWLGMSASVVAQLLPSLGSVVAGFATLPVAFILAVANAAANAPGATVSPSASDAVMAVAVAAVLLALGRRQRGPGRRAARARLTLAALGATACVLLVVPGLRRGRTAPPVSAGVLRVTALDVGQGDATLLQVPGHALLVDAGPPGTRIVPELRAAGVRRLDALVISHPQLDHDGGAPVVLSAMPVSLLLDGRGGDRSASSRAVDPAAMTAGTRIVPAQAGEVLRAGPLRLDVLWPPSTSAPAGGDPNDRAVVAVASAYGSRALLTADAESPVLAPLDLPPVDVLKVSHHGSADPGLPALLDRLRPRAALIEVGRHNTYGHPTAPTLQALASAVPIVRRTDRDGTVGFDLRRGQITEVPAA